MDWRSDFCFGVDLLRFCAGRTRQISTAKSEAVNLHSHGSQHFNRGADIHRIATKTIKRGHDQNISSFQSIHEASKATPLRDGGTPGNCFGNDATRLNPKTGCFNFLNLVFGRLPDC